MIDAYYSVSEYTVLPLENTIFGAVTETLDCFFSKSQYIDNNQTASGSRPSSQTNEKNGARFRKGKEKEIIATLDLPIRHCLVVKRGTKMEDITWVKSHEQVSSVSPSLSSIALMLGTRTIEAVPLEETAQCETYTDIINSSGCSITS
jgi:prephenate dehydratase